MCIRPFSKIRLELKNEFTLENATPSGGVPDSSGRNPNNFRKMI